jgi:hypothetical protein
LGQQASGSFESHVIANAGEDVSNFPASRYRITHAVGGEQWQAVAPRNFNHQMIAGFFLAIEMAL